jgi:hypothetical protein
MNEQDLKQDVWRAVQDVNRAWTTEGNADKLRRYFHPQMVAVTPAARLRLEGGDACTAGWTGFMQAAKILSWAETDPRIDLYGDGRFAVVTYYYEGTFEFNGQPQTLGGRDMMALILEDEGWRVVADHFSPYPRA